MGTLRFVLHFGHMPMVLPFLVNMSTRVRSLYFPSVLWMKLNPHDGHFMLFEVGPCSRFPLFVLMLSLETAISIFPVSALLLVMPSPGYQQR